jgi:hypothetical protein
MKYLSRGVGYSNPDIMRSVVVLPQLGGAEQRHQLPVPYIQNSRCSRPRIRPFCRSEGIFFVTLCSRTPLLFPLNCDRIMIGALIALPPFLKVIVRTPVAGSPGPGAQYQPHQQADDGDGGEYDDDHNGDIRRASLYLLLFKQREHLCGSQASSAGIREIMTALQP